MHFQFRRSTFNSWSRGAALCGLALLAPAANAADETTVAQGEICSRLAAETTPQFGAQDREAVKAFYTARGGTCVGRERRKSASGDEVVALRFAWSDAAELCSRS